MKWLRRKKQKKETATIADKTLTVIAGFVAQLQRLFVREMERVTKGLSIKKLRVCLVVFCVAGSTWAVAVIVMAVTASSSKKGQLSIGKIQMPVVYPNDIENINKGTLLKEQSRIRSFHRYMDSLKEYNRAIYDSILRIRPGLMDSIGKAEQFLQEQ